MSKQSATIEEIAASTEEVTSMIDDAAGEAEEVDTIAAATEEQVMMITDLDDTVPKL